jgi:hypothetical protein
VLVGSIELGTLVYGASRPSALHQDYFCRFAEDRSVFNYYLRFFLTCTETLTLITSAVVGALLQLPKEQAATGAAEPSEGILDIVTHLLENAPRLGRRLRIPT